MDKVIFGTIENFYQAEITPPAKYGIMNAKVYDIKTIEGKKIRIGACLNDEGKLAQTKNDLDAKVGDLIALRIPIGAPTVHGETKYKLGCIETIFNPNVLIKAIEKYCTNSK